MIEGALRKMWGGLWGGLKWAGGLVFGASGAGLVIRGAGATIAAIGAGTIAPIVAGAAALALGSYGLYKGYQWLTSDDDADPSLSEDQKNQKNIANAVVAVNKIRNANLGDIMAGIDPSKNMGQLDLLTRIGTISEKGFSCTGLYFHK